ncbi:hypothetical protein GDO86_002756 [Hymenochirus boettgeri]|uniref:SOCS box domain-containing protein n=1 Tax=Hymenochirus boettgeri TaxID=247094 RepID=A0A8T2JYG4_9PIPI|nr:hypothetical protein GDO86_002756 [Hymenochirus boettgeri]
MFMAVREGHLECVQELLKAGVNPNRSIFNRFSSVQVAAMKGNDRILVELLNYGGEINMRLKPSDIPETIRTSHGPLFIAVVYSHLNCFKTLLLYGSDPDYNCPDLELLQMLKKPRTIMEMCLKSGQRAPFVKLLIEFGANMHLIDDCVIKQIMYNEALEVFLQGKARPRTLMSQCRLSIRKHLRHVRKMTLIHQLDVPQELIRYLKHET